MQNEDNRLLKTNHKKRILKPVPLTKLIPNIFTLIGLVIGISSIRFALDSRWEPAVYCILVATLIDGLDGRIARMLNATSHFGAELDSLCDFINFGLCPALITYLWSFQQYEYKLLSWGSIMVFVVCMAIRLARFNTAIVDPNETEEKGRFFTGVPAPSGAILALIPMILDFEITASIENFSIRNHTILINLYIVIIALLLASRLPTISLKNINIAPEYLSISMILLAVIIIITVIYPWYAFPIAAVFYLLSIPYCVYLKKLPISNN
jgi:CDP-diacylglycerol---serine O-phosphatidyltransferase